MTHPPANPAGEVASRDRPSRHGAILGRALSALADAGRAVSPPMPDTCLTCAFRPGAMTNQMAATGILALNCSIGVDPDDFACHHGMRDGEPTRLCAGYLAAKAAPFPEMRAILATISGEMNSIAQTAEPDTVRADFDRWLATADPDGTMDDYQRSRAYAAHLLTPTCNESLQVADAEHL